MKHRVLLLTLVATISATTSWAIVSYLSGSQVGWLSAITFIVPFALVFGFFWQRWSHQKG